MWLNIYIVVWLPPLSPSHATCSLRNPLIPTICAVDLVCRGKISNYFEVCQKLRRHKIFTILIGGFSLELLPFELLFVWTMFVWTIVHLNYMDMTSYPVYSSNQHINCSFELLISKFSFELLPFEPLFVWAKSIEWTNIW